MKAKIVLIGLCLLLTVSWVGVWADNETPVAPVNSSESPSPSVSPTGSVSQEAPSAFTLTFSLNNDGETFTATIPQVPNGLYSFDGVSYSENNKKTDCTPNTMYTGFVKYAANGEYEESDVVTNTQTTPKLTVKTPVISPDVEGFYDTLTVSISCATPGATIYYTTNGSVPTIASKKYIGPFSINTAGTVRAIAVKDGCNPSEIARRYYKKDKIYKRPARYNVFFETNGGSQIEERKVNRNSSIVPPADPKKEGYAFGGWYADEGLTQPYDFSQRLFKSVTLYAKWVQVSETEEQQMILYIGKREAVVFGKTVFNDVAPVKVNDRAMLPIRFVAENLGATVEWTEETETVTITGSDNVIVIRIGEHYAEVNGQPVKLDSPAFTRNDRTYIPLRFVAESLGATVEWTEDTEKITITK